MNDFCSVAKGQSCKEKAAKLTERLCTLATCNLQLASLQLHRRIGFIVLSVVLPALCIMAVLQLPAMALVSDVEANPVSNNQKNAPLQNVSEAMVKLDEALQTAVSQSQPDEQIRFIIHLQKSANLSPAMLSTDVETRRATVINLLQETAVSTQTPLITQLNNLQKAGSITQYRPFWIFNGIGGSGTANAILELAAQPAVAEIKLDAYRSYFKPPVAPFTGAESFEPLAVTAVPTHPLKSWGIEQIQAEKVWRGLGVDGTGVVVAIMDSGVDWQHPDLLPNYRGNLGDGNFDHSGSWYYPVIPTVTVPTDTFGHGTHVAGTAVGQNGIGVAPGAKWIAVGLTSNGLIYDSDIHAGFEWLLAPNGDPALAPDVINNSWGASGQATTFIEDIDVLHAAGIITVFSAGNSGPGEGTIGTPASYPDTIAVGASDELDEIAWFSSRGPSPLSEDVQPHIVAPGTLILSSYPGGGYRLLNGTSMAAPHTTGAIALMLSANPGLTREQLLTQLKQTAVSNLPPHPNYDAGWGRLDAYTAVADYVTTGQLQGVVSGNGTPLPDVSLTIINPSGGEMLFASDASGQFSAPLIPGNYMIQIAPFGYVSQTIATIVVTANQTTIQNIDLVSVPQGGVSGVVRDAETAVPISGAIISVEGVGITVTSDQNGQYSLSLPEQQFKLLVSASGYRLGHALLLPSQSAAIQQDFALAPAPSVLLVDAGRWSFISKIDYYNNALTDLDYAPDLWSIRNPFDDIPTAADLVDYDVVIWSEPYYSPGWIGASSVITQYLESGGNLFISGQNVGIIDGSGFSNQRWWYEYLRGQYLGKTAVTYTISGVDGSPFAGLNLSLNGGSSAANQLEVDVSQPQSNSVTEPIFYYDDGTIAGLQAGRCESYRIVYLGFGLEGVNQAVNRAAILDDAFDYFDSPKTMIGSRWEEADVNEFAIAGEKLIYTVTLRNMSETLTDTFSISLANSSWSSSLVTKTLTLGPCETGQTAVSIQVPSNVAKDSVDDLWVTAVSGFNPFDSSSLRLHHKTPGRILLVDDDRWYDQEALFKAHLDNMNISYDVWTTGWTGVIKGSPPAEFLNEYDIIIWFTGYDWFAPVTTAEREALSSFLENGGRLFLNSQDFLFYHYQSGLAQQQLGVIDYRESMSPTAVFGGALPQMGSDLAGPLPLEYGPYLNFSDGIIPNPDGVSLLWHNAGLPAATGLRGDKHRAVLMSVPLETLPESAQPAVMNSLVGWLGDLGASSFVVDSRTGNVGEPRTFTLTIQHLDVGVADWITAVTTLPPELTIDPGSIGGGALYDPATRQLSWTGELASGAAHQIVYQATPSVTLPAGTQVESKMTLSYARHGLLSDQFATFWITAPDLSQSTVTAVANQPYGATAVNYLIELNNSGLAATNGVSASLKLPDRLYPVTSTLTTTVGTAVLSDNQIIWQADLNPGETITAFMMMTRTASSQIAWMPTAVIIQDGVTATILRENWLVLEPYMRFFPIIAQD